MTAKSNPPRELSKVARDYFGLKSLAWAMGAATAFPYFIPISLAAFVAWIFLSKKVLERYGKRGRILFYLAPALALIGSVLAFLGAEWRWAMSMTYVILILPLVLYATRPSALWNDEHDQGGSGSN